MIKQRVYAITLGHEDLNDHHALRQDPAIQTAVGRWSNLASASTLCRMENKISRKTIVNVHKIFVDKFIRSFDSPPSELILDFDATDDRVHGNQEGRFFHGYYDHYCFLPLYVFCGDQLLVSYLRPSKIDGAKHSWAILSLLVKKLRQQWPAVKIIFRGDSGFCRHRMLSWCEKHDVDYIVGLPGNARLKRMTEALTHGVEEDYEQTKEKQRRFDVLKYGAKSWGKDRKVIAKAEHSTYGENLRFVVTNLEGEAQALYDEVYCQRGDMENRIKEQKQFLFADRTSAHRWWANQWRVMLSSLAYVLMETIRRVALVDTRLARAQVGTLRLKLLKIGGVILKNTRRIRFLLSSTCPDQDLFQRVVQRLYAKPG